MRKKYHITMENEGFVISDDGLNGKDIVTFKTHEEAIAYCNNEFSGYYEILDSYLEVIVIFKKAEDGFLMDKEFMFQYEADEEAMKKWGLHPRYLNDNENDYRPDCRHCGDGGCIHCSPRDFFDGHIGF